MPRKWLPRHAPRCTYRLSFAQEPNYSADSRIALPALLHVNWCCTLTSAGEMKTNITLKIESALLQEARVLAAEEGTSISALLAARLEQTVRERKGYDQARRRALARLRKGYDLRWTPPSSRDELHER